MQSISDIISRIINFYIGSIIGVKYKAKLSYLDAISCRFTLLPLSVIEDTHTADIGILDLKNNTPRLNELCKVLNNRIKGALSNDGNTELIDSTLRIDVTEDYKVYCSFGIKHINSDTEVMFELEL